MFLLERKRFMLLDYDVCKENTQMETIYRKTSRKTEVSMGRRCQERPEEDETQNGQNKSKIASNGTELLRRPKLYQSCSAKQEEKFVSLSKHFSSQL